MANPLLMLKMSAMSAKVKRTVLSQEVVTIRRNIRPELDWEVTVSHLDNLSRRMAMSGWSEKERMERIRAVIGYDQMLKVEREGGRPVNRPKSWEEDLRQKKKESKKKNWFRKGGFDVPLFIPHTPGGLLARRMREKEADNNQGRRIRFKMIEKAGVTLERKLRRSNPWKGGNCGRPRCFPCRGEKGGDCWKEGVNYSLFCEECGERVAAYLGETHRNAYNRGVEHLDNLEAKNEDKSVLWLHSVHHHQGREGVDYSMRVTGSYSDCLDRQTMEMVRITNFKGAVLMNRRNEMGGVRVERTRYRRWGASQ